MLTLPERFFLPFDPWWLSLSFSFRLPPGVEGCDLTDGSKAVEDEVGERRGLVGDCVRGGVTGLALGAVGVGGINCNSGADLVTAREGGMDDFAASPAARPIERSFFSFFLDELSSLFS